MTKYTLLVALAACGGSQHTRPDAPAPPDLAGRWKSACAPQPQADGSTLYATLDLTIPDAHTWSLDYSLHGDAACTMKLVTVAIHGPYQLLQSSAAVAGAWEARFAFDDKTIAPFAQPIADALTGAHCGAGAWSLGQAQSVYAAGCPAFGQYPQARCGADFDLVGVSGGSLRFGERPADNDLCSADKRPVKLSGLALVKQ